jgi:hypothetical protein
VVIVPWWWLLTPFPVKLGRGRVCVVRSPCPALQRWPSTPHPPPLRGGQGSGAVGRPAVWLLTHPHPNALCEWWHSLGPLGTCRGLLGPHAPPACVNTRRCATCSIPTPTPHPMPSTHPCPGHLDLPRSLAHQAARCCSLWRRCPSGTAGTMSAGGAGFGDSSKDFATSKGIYVGRPVWVPNPYPEADGAYRRDWLPVHASGRPLVVPGAEAVRGEVGVCRRGVGRDVGAAGVQSNPACFTSLPPYPPPPITTPVPRPAPTPQPLCKVWGQMQSPWRW